jgi:hypothetical protein
MSPISIPAWSQVGHLLLTRKYISTWSTILQYLKFELNPLSSPTSRERESTSALLEELEWVPTTMIGKWILLLSRMRIIWVISIIISLP